MKPVVEIDGCNFASLAEFAGEFSRLALAGHKWKGNLDALNDILRGGFGTPEGGFILRWLNSGLSKERLGYAETIRQLESRLSQCHPSSRSSVVAALEAAKAGEGPTVFDWIVQILREHGDGGVESEDGIELELR